MCRSNHSCKSIMAINPSYANTQLLAAVTAAESACCGTEVDPRAGARAAERVRRWLGVLRGMQTRTTTIGARCPVDTYSPSVTLEVANGGFATGYAMAAGMLHEHERNTLDTLPELPQTRDALQAWYLTDSGLETLRNLLRSGAYTLTTPEEAALPIVAWLLQQADSESREAATALLDEIQPFLGELRFVPIPCAAADADPAFVSAGTDAVDTVPVGRYSVQQAREELAEVRTKRSTAMLYEALHVWAPLYDALLQLWLQALDSQGELPAVFSSEWKMHAAELCAQHGDACAKHRLCQKPHKANSTYAILRVAAHTIVACDVLSDGKRRQVQHRVAHTVAAKGKPNSIKYAARRKRQAFDTRKPMADSFALVVSSRLAALRPQCCVPLEDTRELLSPVVTASCPTGADVPPKVARHVWRSVAAPLPQLVAHGLVPSCEALAALTPAIGAACTAAAYPDTDLARLMAALHKAFAQRRSLLLLNMESQVRIDELPWAAAVAPQADPDHAADAAASAFRRIAALTLSTFPGTLLPNKLVEELRVLAKAAEAAGNFLIAKECGESAAPRKLALVKELAADIFMNGFSPKFLSAAHIAAQLLVGSAYERYYDADFAAVLVIAHPADGVREVPELYTMCEQRAQTQLSSPSERRRSWQRTSYMASSGAIIEQAQVLTTYNLAALAASGVVPSRGWLAAAHAAWRTVCTLTARALRKRCNATAKRAAFAWRQLVFFVAMVDEVDECGSQLQLLADLAAALQEGAWTPAVRSALQPHLAALLAAVNGAVPNSPLLGWVHGLHPLLA